MDLILRCPDRHHNLIKVLAVAALAAICQAGFGDVAATTGCQNYLEVGTTVQTYVTFHRVVGNFKDLRIWYGAWVCPDTGTGEQPLGNDYSVQGYVDIQYPDGTRTMQILHFGKTEVGTVRNDLNTCSNVIKGDFPDGTLMWIHQTPSGGPYPLQGSWNVGLDEGIENGSKLLISGRRFGPVCITGTPTDDLRHAVPAIFGDSYESTGRTAVNEYGVVRRSLANNVAGIWFPGDPDTNITYALGYSDAAYIRADHHGYAFADDLGAACKNRRMFAQNYSDYVIITLGITCLREGWENMRHDLLSLCGSFPGKTIVVRTIGMLVDTTDACTTAMNQTPVAATEPDRQQYNNWLRNHGAAAISAVTGAPAYVWDAFKDVEVNKYNYVIRNGGRWRVIGSSPRYTFADGCTSTSLQVGEGSIIYAGHRGGIFEKNQFRSLPGIITYSDGTTATCVFTSNKPGSELDLLFPLARAPQKGDKLRVIYSAGGISESQTSTTHPSEYGCRVIAPEGHDLLMSIPLPTS